MLSEKNRPNKMVLAAEEPQVVWLSYRCQIQLYSAANKQSSGQFSCTKEPANSLRHKLVSLSWIKSRRCSGLGGKFQGGPSAHSWVFSHIKVAVMARLVIVSSSCFGIWRTTTAPEALLLQHHIWSCFQSHFGKIFCKDSPKYLWTRQ